MALVRKEINWNNKSSSSRKKIPGPYHRAAVLAQVRTTPYQRRNQGHAMRLSPGNKPMGKVGTRSMNRDNNVPVQDSAPEEQIHNTLPRIPAEHWQCCSLQSEKGPRPKTQDFFPEPVTLKAPTTAARHLTGRRRGTQPCSPAFCHVPCPPSSAVRQPPSNSAAGPGRGGTRWMQGSPGDILQDKGDRPSLTTPGAGLEPPGFPRSEQERLVHNTCSPSREAQSPSV